MTKTFKQLQDSVLQWMADEQDTGLMRDLVQQALDKVQKKILTAEQYDFMLVPMERTLSVVAGQQSYALPEDFLSMLWLRYPDTDEFVEEVPLKTQEEAEDGLDVNGQGWPLRYRIVSVQGVKAQPASAGTVTITPSGGNEAAVNGIVLQGLDSNGEWLEETLSSGTTWASLTSTGSFSKITNVIKTGATWTRTITVARGATTLLTLTASQFAKQYHMLEFTSVPTQDKTLEFRYYTKPLSLVYDNQLPQLPSVFTDVLEYETLKLLAGFTKATPEELSIWHKESEYLFQQLRQNYQQARSLGARARRVRMVERL